MKKKNENKIQISEYWESLNTSIKVFFIISCVLFVAEMIFDFFVGSNWDYTSYLIYSVKTNGLSYRNIEDIYYFTFPILYILFTLIIVYMRKINKITLLLLLVLRVTYPTTAELLLTLLIAGPIEISRGSWG